MNLFATNCERKVLILDPGCMHMKYNFSKSSGKSNFFGKNKIQELDFILVPFCNEGHWCLFKIDMLELKITSYDSMLVPRVYELKQLKEIMEMHMKNIGFPKEFQIEEKKDVEIQRNNFDCGMYVLGFSKQLLGLPTEFSQGYIDQERKNLQVQINENMKYNFTYEEDDPIDIEEN